MRYKLYANKINMGNILIQEGDDLQDVRHHYADIEYDLEFTSAIIIDSIGWKAVSFIDFTLYPRDDVYVKKLNHKNNEG